MRHRALSVKRKLAFFLMAPAHTVCFRDFFCPIFTFGGYTSEYLPNLSSKWNFKITELEIFAKESNQILVKFIYSEKATKFCEIFPLLLTVCTVIKSKGKISQNFVAFSEYMNYKSEVEILQKIVAFSEYTNFKEKFSEL